MDTAFAGSIPQLYNTAAGEVSVRTKKALSQGIEVTSHPNPVGGQNRNSNTRVIARLMIVVVGMFGFGFAMVPLYDVFCDITGINGKTGDQITLAEGLQVDTSREIEVEFIASLNDSMPWEFKPMQHSVKVHPGQPTRITYVAVNNTDRAITGQAVPSVAPGLAAEYFQKTECFCFTEQRLEPGEEKQMPVIFVVDPNLPEDISQLALSYTFFIKPSGTQEIAASLKHKSNQEL
ncbi:MAG: cytochrome c oxidase assembly protein [Gammaproteobacteria bacterium]|jgi:cytochrome c oxidase assembly protein subunit 11